MMKILCMSAVLVVLASGAVSDFPAFDVLHNHCQVKVTYPDTMCVEIYRNLIENLNKFNAGLDPAKGTYKYKEKQPISYVWVIHDDEKTW